MMGANSLQCAVMCSMLVLIGCAGKSAVAAETWLVREGKSEYRIVLPPNPAPAERYAAEELQTFLKQSTGAELAITEAAAPTSAPATQLTASTQPTAPEIWLGANPRLNDAAPDAYVGGLGEEGYIIRTIGPAMVICGGGPRGTLYGVYDFLENVLGVRFFAPDCTRVPKHESLALPQLNRRIKPVWEYREISYTHAYDPTFAARIRLNGQYPKLTEKQGGNWRYQPFVHSFHQLVPPGTYAKTHPEYYSLINGKRDPTGQLCLTNPEVVEIAAESVRKILRARPDVNIVSVSHMDYGKWCQCPRCRQFDLQERRSTSWPDHCEMPAVLNFVNQIAERIEKEFPSVWIDTLAYGGTWCAPATLHARRNVIVRYCPIGLCYSHTITDDPQNAWIYSHLKEWQDNRAKLFIWDYVVTFSHYFVPYPNWDVLKPNLQTFRQHGATGYFGQAGYTSRGTEFAELRTYVLARLLWDESLETDALINEFLTGYYGPAAPPIAQYITMLRNSVKDPAVHLHLGGDPLLRPFPGTTLALRQRFPDAGRSAMAFAYATFDSDTAGEAEFTIGSNSDMKIWVNGKEAYTFTGSRKHESEKHLVKVPGVAIQSGTNHLLIQSGRRGGEWMLSVNVEGKPAPAQWLLLGPLPASAGKDPLAENPLGDPANVKPQPGQSAAGQTWQMHKAPDGPRYLSDAMLAEAQGLFDQAKKEAANDPQLLLRVRIAEMPIRYCMIWRMPPEQRRTSPLVEEFIQLCEAAKITEVGEGHTWRLQAKNIRDQIAKVWNLTPASK